MLDEIKLMLGITNNDSDRVLELMLRDAIQAVLNYCNIASLPMGLEHVVRQTVVAAFNYQNGGNVESVKRGDTLVSYSEPIGVGDFTDIQKQSLNAFRKWRKR